MYTELIKIGTFIFNDFLHIWPYLLITIPLSVAVRMSGAANYINRAFSHRPHTAIILAAVVGAFSPFCSCGVIPVVASLLLGGVPLAPVMAFWIASPSMDPEIFFLSVAVLGWKLAVWRLASTLILSLASGYITHYIAKTGWLGNDYLTIGTKKEPFSIKRFVTGTFSYIRRSVVKAGALLSTPKVTKVPVSELCCSTADNGSVVISDLDYSSEEPAEIASSCSCSSPVLSITLPVIEQKEEISTCCSSTINTSSCGCSTDNCGTEDIKSIKADTTFFRRLSHETISASVMVMKFMGLAFLLESLIELYVPQDLIISTMGGNNPFSVLWAAILGVPVYTSNLAALPLIGSLLAKGMNGGAALAFLISGPVTTIPAMAAVYGLVNKKVFSLYVGFSFFGALVFGYLLYFASMF